MKFRDNISTSGPIPFPKSSGGEVSPPTDEDTRADYERRLAAQTEAVAAEKVALSTQQQANERRAAELAAAAEVSRSTSRGPSSSKFESRSSSSFPAIAKL
jgi:hypothetical protein